MRLLVLLAVATAVAAACPPRQALSTVRDECVWIQCARGRELRWGLRTLMCSPSTREPCSQPRADELLARDQHGRCLLVDTSLTWLATPDGLSFVTTPRGATLRESPKLGRVEPKLWSPPSS